SPDAVLRDTLYTWIESEPFKAQVSFQADSLTAVMLLVITGIGFLIHLYSTGYMAHDEGEARFFAYLNLFVFFMSVLVLADNLLLFFVGWEGVGLCSFLLIGFWYEDPANTTAGNKAFIVNRIGDFAFLLGMLLLFWEMNRLGVPSLDFAALKDAAARIAPDTAVLITLLFFIGATGKSAQIPLYVWRPDARERADPRRDDGDRGRLSDGAAEFSLCPRALHAFADRNHRRCHGALRRHDRRSAERHQARACVFDRQPAGLHVSGGRRRRVQRRRLSPVHARVFQGVPVSRRGQRHPRDGRRAGHAQDGRAAPQAAGDVLDVSHRGTGTRGHPADCGLFLEGSDLARSLREPARLASALACRLDHGGAHRVLHVPPVVPRLSRHEPRAGVGAGARPRVARGDD